jgi:DNA polymerase-1
MKNTYLLSDRAGYSQGLLLERESFFPEIPKMPFNVRCVTTVKDLIEFVTLLSQQTWFSFDTETTNINPRRALLVGMSFCWQPDEAWYIPVQCPRGEHCLTINYVLENVAPYLENPEYKKLGQNIKYDKIVLRNHGIDLKGIAFDTLIASYLLDAGSRRHNLDLLAKKYLNHDTIHLAELIGRGKRQLGTKDVPLECMAAYAAEDAWVVAQIAPMLYAEAERQGLTKLLDHVEIPLVSVLADMEYNGIKVDLEKASALQIDFESRIATRLSDIREQTNGSFNPNSSLQLKDELYGTLGLPIAKRTPRGEASTDKTTLSELAKGQSVGNELAANVVKYRELTKLLGTYVASLPDVVFEETGRIHASFNQAVTATGRLSSSDPNLQNIPSRTEDGKKIRKLFVSEPGYVLLSADYSQIELRVLAHYSGDPRLQEAFRAGEDIHTYVASKMSKVPIRDVTEQVRKVCKNMNFGVLYGQGPRKLSEKLAVDGIVMSKAEAQRFIEEHYQEFPLVKSFKRSVINGCRKNGYVTTILGRRRYIPAINDPDGPDRWEAERMAVNTVIQGSAADMIKLAMLEIYGEIVSGYLEAKILLQVHDELVFEVPLWCLKPSLEIIKRTMEGVIPLSVPTVVDIAYGPSWEDMETYARSNN